MPSSRPSWAICGTNVERDRLAAENPAPASPQVGLKTAPETSFSGPLFHVKLPPRGDDQKAVKQVHTLHVIIKNEG